VLATRVIPVILARGQQAVKGKGFDSWRSVGQLRQAIRVYEMRGVDEVFLLDIAATPEGRGPNVAFVKEFSGEFFCPVCVGGGVTTLCDFRDLLANGADKVAINTAAVDTPDLINEAAERFGSQAVVVSIDVKDGHVQTYCGRRSEPLTPVDWAREVVARGAGEILLNSVDRDGTLAGYDLALIRDVACSVSVPVVACGGAGSYEDLRLAVNAGAHAVAAGALWHFTDSTPAEAAEYLASHGIEVRRRFAPSQNIRRSA
jgi:cyclase